MNSFSAFNIKINEPAFTGDKIKISKVIGKEIIVHAFRIKDSKIFKEHGTGKCLHIQISINDEKHILFTSSGGLIDAIQQIPEGGFPFSTIIVKEDERLIFT
jgi:hypothetical protein